MSKVWLITGSGNGLGRDIAEAALAAGDSVVAGARRTEELAPLVAQYGERVKPVKLEVRDEAAAKAAVQLAVDAFGRLDVLVNNAGYGQFAPFVEFQTMIRDAIERRIFRNDLPVELISKSLAALVEATIDLTVLNPSNANRYRDSGFQMFWAGITK